jgi:hypothetical protein
MENEDQCIIKGKVEPAEVFIFKDTMDGSSRGKDDNNGGGEVEFVPWIAVIGLNQVYLSQVFLSFLLLEVANDQDEGCDMPGDRFGRMRLVYQPIFSCYVSSFCLICKVNFIESCETLQTCLLSKLINKETRVLNKDHKDVI